MTPDTLNTSDRLAIHELMSLYGHIIDEQQWERVDQLFTDDVVYDMSDFDLGVQHGIDAVRTLWTTRLDQHPLAHHATNVVIGTVAHNDEVEVLSKGIGVGRRGRVGSVVYRDIVRRTPRGWRIASRRASLRTASKEE